MKNIEANMNVFEGIYDRLILFATTITNNAQLSEDIVQEVCAKVIELNPILQNNTHRKNYFYRAVRNEAIHVLKIESRAIPFSEEWINSVGKNLKNANADFEIFDWLQRNVADLPEKTIEAFLRYALYNEKINDLAFELEMQPATLRQQFHRLRIKLQKRYLLISEIILLIRMISVT